MYFRHVAGLAELTAAHVRLAGPQAETPLKADRVVTGMLMGAGSIGDMNLLRACGLHHVLTEVRAPSTLGSFMRSFDHGTVRRLPPVHRRLLPGLARRARGLNVLAAGISARTATTPLITGTRLRGGSASGTRGAASLHHRAEQRHRGGRSQR